MKNWKNSPLERTEEMPTNRVRMTRTRRSDLPLDETIITFLFTGKTPERDTPGWKLYVSRFFDDNCERIKETWLQYREILLQEWKETGKTGLPWAEKKFNDTLYEGARNNE